MALYDPAMYHFDQPAASCWQDMVPRTEEGSAALDGDRDCDVAILGGGLTGLSAALHLARDHGIAATVLEAGEVAWGASGRNGGFCSLYPSTLSIKQMDSRYGTAATDAFVTSQREAIEWVDALARDEGIDVSRQGDGVYEVAHLPSRFTHFEAEAELYSRRFGIPSRAVPRSEFAASVYDSTEQFGALHTRCGFGLNPLAFSRGVAAAAVRYGARIHPHSEVTAWRTEGSQHRLLTRHGSVRARRVIVATNGYTPEGLVPGVAGRNVPVISNIVTTRPLGDDELAAQNWLTESPCSNTRRMLFYYRLLADRRFLFGARGDTTGSPADAVRMRAWITRRLGEVFPAWRDIPTTHYWRGFVCMNARGTPMLGALDEDARVLYALAFHGSGVAAAPWSGRMLADIAAGARGLDAIPLVMRGPAPRLPLAGLRLWYLRAALAWYRLQDRR